MKTGHYLAAILMIFTAVRASAIGRHTLSEPFWTVSVHSGLMAAAPTALSSLENTGGEAADYHGVGLVYATDLRLRYALDERFGLGVRIGVLLDEPTAGMRPLDDGRVGLRTGMDAVAVQLVGAFRITHVQPSSFSFVASLGAGIALATERQRTWYYTSDSRLGTIAVLDDVRERRYDVASMMARLTTEYTISDQWQAVLDVGADALLWPGLPMDRYTFVGTDHEVVSLRVERRSGLAVRPLIQLGIQYQF